MDKYGEVDSVKFAIYLEKKARERGIYVNMTKIQKLLYICYGLWLAVEQKQLLNERPKAWNHGPVFPKVHKTQKKNGDGLEKLEGTISPEDFKKYDETIDVTLKLYGKWTANQLVDWTHKKGTAWDKKFNILGEKYGTMDSLDILTDFEELFPK